MTIGVIILVITGLLVYFGAAHRVLDRLHLTDSMALFFIALIIIGSYFELTIRRSPLLTINIGGGLIPIALAFYVLYRADSSKELIRAIVAVVLTAGAIYGISYFFRDFGHGRDIIDPLYLYAVSGGIIAYILGRSRRASFIAGTLGFLLFNLFTYYRVLTGRIVSQVRIGGAGAFDSIIISGILAVLLAEIIGESRERLQGGPAGEKNRGDSNEK
ncbi:DUF1614 domain-containing protein [Iocasia frigidifontis]|uniref:DUF1614 domain-containing protein n=1 Tax=Iocasia fonsfrigidae TaxID=2682810 RepID=A0A8A7KEX0_9FIRM|nr:DUF1614 domain-containing protein [Iocasia fonsfrigidae]QTL98228.1 DUF1614 domain-containing protein [Iocasia fonsfrigidae]